MEYLLHEMMGRVGVNKAPDRDELVRWSYGDAVANSAGGFAELYLSADGSILTVDIQNDDFMVEDYMEEGIGQIYMQAEKMPGHQGFRVTRLQIDGYEDFDLNDGITVDLGLSIIFGSINEIKMKADRESFSCVSRTLVEDERRRERLQQAQENSDGCKIIDFNEARRQKMQHGKLKYGA